MPKGLGVRKTKGSIHSNGNVRPWVESDVRTDDIV